MKNKSFKYFFMVLALGSVGFLSSCNKDEETDPVNQDPGVSNHQAILLGNQLNTTEPNFYSSSDNKRYNLADAKTNAATVDFGYGNGAAGGNEYFIGSPDDESMKFVYNNATNGLQTWSKLNATRFKTVQITSAQFDTLSTEAALLAAVAAGTDPLFPTRVRGTEIDPTDVIGFTTASGKKGLFKVISRTGTSAASGSITLDIKVQKED